MPDNNDELKKYLDYDGLAYLLQRFPKTTVHCTFDDEFAGETATLTHGTTTYTKTVPATSPYELTFAVNELGTWTLQSSYLGTQYSDTVDITYLGQKGEIELTIVPDGSTAEPINSIHVWLKCANLNKSYTTLAEVLADTETYETLLADSNACQYMKRSTAWALVEGAVPAMTSNTTPSGICSAQSIYGDNYKEYFAFDKNMSGNGWIPLGSATVNNTWIQYEFPTAKIINTIQMYQRVAGNIPAYSKTTVFKLLGSNTGNENDFTEIANNLTLTGWNVLVSNSFNNITAYKYYRIVPTDVSATQSNVGLTTANGYKFQFYEADITHNQDAMARLGKFDYASNLLSTDATWAAAISNSDYMDSVWDTKVPTMTGTTTPEGQATASSENGQLYGYKVFDGNLSTAWHSSATSSQQRTDWIFYKFTKQVCIKRVELTTTSAPGPKVSMFQGSNDGTNWTDIGSFVDCPTTGNVKYSKNYPENTNSYLYYRLYITESNYSSGGNYATTFAELQFYGRASEEVLVPLVPTMTSNTTPSGVCSADTEYSTYLAWKAFDGSTASSDGWIANSGSFPHWIKYEFPSAIKVNAAGFRNINGNHAYAIKNYKIQGSNDDESWIDLYTGINNNYSNNDLWTVNFDNSTAYKYYRVYIIDGWSSNPNYRCDIGFIQFYAKTVQTNIIHSAANDTIYMLEDGDPIVLATTNSDGDGILDFSQLPAGPVTLYSSVAKDSDDLTADYSKTITITKTQYGGTTEAYLMPDTIKTLYWYGNNNEPMKSYAVINISGVTGIEPVIADSTNYRTIYITTNVRRGYYATIQKVPVGSIPKAHIKQAYPAGTGSGASLLAASNITTSPIVTNNYVVIADTPNTIVSECFKTFEDGITEDSYIGFYMADGNASGSHTNIELYAFWYE